MSKYFDTIFEGDSADKSSSKGVVLDNIDAVTFKTILEHIYMERTPTVDANNVETLLKAGVFLGTDDIVWSCESYISTAIPATYL